MKKKKIASTGTRTRIFLISSKGALPLALHFFLLIVMTIKNLIQRKMFSLTSEMTLKLLNSKFLDKSAKLEGSEKLRGTQGLLGVGVL